MRHKGLIIGSLIFSGAALAQLPVTDGAHIIETVANGVTLVKQFVQLKQTYQQAVDMAKNLPGTAARWSSAHLNWNTITSSNTFGTNAAWNQSVNTGTNITQAMAQITTVVNSVSVASAPASFQQALKQSISAIERHDGLIAGTSGVSGAYFVGNPSYTKSLQNLAQSVTGNNDSELTYAAQMQKQAAAQMLSAQGINALTQLQQRALINQQAVMLQQRQAYAAEVNQQLYTYQNAQANLPGTDSMTAALTALKVP